MHRAAAETVEGVLREVSARLDETIGVVRANSTEDEFYRYRQLVGRLMGEIFLEILQPIYTEHPDLVPNELRPPGDDVKGQH